MTALLLLLCSQVEVAGRHATRVRMLFPQIEEVCFHSSSLGREMRFIVIHPVMELASATNAERPVLYFLHGRGRNLRSLIDLPGSRQQLLDAGYWIVLPDAENGWYLNSPVDPDARYGDYLEEAIQVSSAQYALSSNQHRRAIAGWSMGGYGAVRFAETHPYEVGTVASIIGVLDFPREETLPAGQNYKVPVARFGQDVSVWRTLNPINFVETLRGKAVLLITAENAFDRTMNTNFSKALSAAGIQHQFSQLPGGHTLDVVQAALPMVLEFVRREIVSGSAAPESKTSP